jgi:uncharacterized protein
MERPVQNAADRSTPRPAVVSVRGEAELVVDPELVEFTVSVSAQARERREAFERLVKRNDEILALVRSYGDSVDKVESTGVAVAPELRKGRDEKVRSYSGVVRVKVTIADFSVLGELLARVADTEVAAIDGPYWRLRRASPVYREVRTRAVAEAVARAQDYAGALGSRITGLIELSDTGLSVGAKPVAYGPAGQRGMMMRAARSTSVATEPPTLDLEPVEQTVHASVEASFEATQPDL